MNKSILRRAVNILNNKELNAFEQMSECLDLGLNINEIGAICDCLAERKSLNLPWITELEK